MSAELTPARSSHPTKGARRSRPSHPNRSTAAQIPWGGTWLVDPTRLCLVYFLFQVHVARAWVWVGWPRPDPVLPDASRDAKLCEPDPN